MPKTPEFDTANDTATAGPPAEDIAPAPTFAQRAAGLAELVREHPKTAIAAGAVVAAGVAAAIPLARRGRANGGANANAGGERATRRTAARKSTARSPKKG